MDLTALTTLFASVPGAILVFARVAALFLAGPIIGEVYTPMQVKTLLALAVTSILYPLALANVPAVPFDAWFPVLLVKETMVGLSLGFFVNLFLHGVRFGGDLLNRHAGFSAAENFDPDTQASITPLGDLMHLLVLLLFLAADGHHFFFAALARSYDLIPLGGWQLTPGFHAALAQGLNEMSVIALAISFPVLAAVMAITAVEGVVTRAVPQINVMHVSFAVKIVVSLLVLYSGLPAAVAFLGGVLATMQGAGYALLGVMS
jgi:flagellar biosynthetic protein FliR